MATAAPLTNTAPVDPNLIELRDDYKKRIKQQQSSESTPDQRLNTLYDQYQQRLGADNTKQAIGRASLSIADAASGQKANLAEAAAARGITGTGVASDLGGRIDEAARRRQAGAATDITLQRENAKDALVLGGLGIAGAQSNLNLARAAQTNALLNGATGAALAPLQQNLAERQFGLNQYSTQAQVDLARQAEERARQAQQEQAYRNAIASIPTPGVSVPFVGGTAPVGSSANWYTNANPYGGSGRTTYTTLG